MMTSLECLAKAAEMDALAALCSNAPDRNTVIETANGWRATPVLARQQEVYETLDGRLV